MRIYHRHCFVAALLATAGLLCACTKTPTLKGVRATKTRVESTVTTTSSGTVQAQQQVVLGFGSNGRVAQIWARAGDKVTPGAKIAQLDNGDLQVTYDEASKEYQRSQKLLKEGLVSRAAFDEARKNAEVARANFDRTILRAPFAGIVTEMNVELGEQVSPTAAKVVARLIDLKPRIVKGDVDEIDLGKIHIGQSARIRVPAVRNEPFAAVVSRVVPFVDTTKEQDRTSQIELRMTEAKEIIPVGASAEIEVIIGEKNDALAAPTRVVLGSDPKYVYKWDGTRLSKVTIKPGAGNYDRTEILQGVTAGDILVFPAEDIELADKMKANVEVIAWP